MIRSAAVLVTLVTLAACARVPTDGTPDGALELFLEAMGRAEDDPTARRRAFELLAPESRRAIAERARLASSLGSRRFEPWEMIAEGRYRLRFRPREVDGFTVKLTFTMPVMAGQVNTIAIGVADALDTVGDSAVLLGAGSITSAVPEPSAWALMLAGLAASAGIARRRKLG